ncbi:glycosyltransferase [Streptomyces sp. ISL-96]|nr:glycosyltransferase [Streptomyces sp. ISL-96]
MADMQGSVRAGELDVVIATRDRPAHKLAACLGALWRQSFEHFGVILVDDGGRDPVAPRVEASHPTRPIRVIRNAESVGPTASRNKGVALSDAPYVLFIDDDCISHPELVARHHAALARAAGPVVSLGPILSPPGRRLPPWTHWDADRLGGNTLGWAAARAPRRGPTATPATSRSVARTSVPSAASTNVWPDRRTSNSASGSSDWAAGSHSTLSPSSGTTAIAPSGHGPASQPSAHFSTFSSISSCPIPGGCRRCARTCVIGTGCCASPVGSAGRRRLAGAPSPARSEQDACSTSYTPIDRRWRPSAWSGISNTPAPWQRRHPPPWSSESGAGRT